MNTYEKELQIISWLKNYKFLQASIKYLQETIEDIAGANMGIVYDKGVVSKTNKLNSVVENAVIQMDELDITNRIKSLTNTIRAIDGALSALSEVEKAVIINRCMKGQYYYQFIGDIGYSERTAHTIKRNAIKRMVEFIFGSAEAININPRAM